MRKFFRYLFLLLLAPMLYAFVAQAFLFIFNHFLLLWSNWFIYGAIGYFVLHAIMLWSKIKFLETFEHELGHTLVAYLFFRRVVEFFASTREDSYVLWLDRPNTFRYSFILMAPYFLPVLTLPFLIIKPFMAASAHKTMDFFLGLTLAFHFIALSKEFRPSYQTDIQKVGLPYALATVLVCNSIFTVLTLSFAFVKYTYVFTYFKNSFLAGWKIYVWISAKLFSPTTKSTDIFLKTLASYT